MQASDILFPYTRTVYSLLSSVSPGVLFLITIYQQKYLQKCRLYKPKMTKKKYLRRIKTKKKTLNQVLTRQGIFIYNRNLESRNSEDILPSNIQQFLNICVHRLPLKLNRRILNTESFYANSRYSFSIHTHNLQSIPC